MPCVCSLMIFLRLRETWSVRNNRLGGKVRWQWCPSPGFHISVGLVQHSLRTHSERAQNALSTRSAHAAFNPTNTLCFNSILTVWKSTSKCYVLWALKSCRLSVTFLFLKMINFVGTFSRMHEQTIYFSLWKLKIHPIFEIFYCLLYAPKPPCNWNIL